MKSFVKSIVLALISAAASGLVSCVATNASMENSIVTEMSEYFASVDKGMSYKQAIATVYEENQTLSTQVQQLQNENSQLGAQVESAPDIAFFSPSLVQDGLEISSGINNGVAKITGHVFTISEQTQDAIRRQNIALLDNHLQEIFLKCGVLLDDDVDESNIISYYFNKSKFSSSTTAVTILLTWACNFRCVYCYEGAGEINNSVMTKSVADSVIRFVINQSNRQNSRYINVMLFGGEPLLNIDIGFYILEKLKDYCDERGKILSCAMVTNGSLLSTEILNKLVKFGCNMIQITLDGPPEIHNKRRISKSGTPTFDCVINAIKLLEKYDSKIRSVIRINIDKENFKEIPKLLSYIKEIGIQSSKVDFGVVRSSTKACKSYESHCFEDSEVGGMLAQLWNEAEKMGFSTKPVPSRKWNYCGLYNDYNFTISPLGELYKCWELVGDSRHKCGNIDVNGEVRNLSSAFFDWMAIDPTKEEVCRNCVYLPVCGGGCKIISVNNGGTYNAPGCARVKGVVEEACVNYLEKREKSLKTSD